MNRAWKQYRIGSDRKHMIIRCYFSMTPIQHRINNITFFQIPRSSCSTKTDSSFTMWHHLLQIYHHGVNCRFIVLTHVMQCMRASDKFDALNVTQGDTLFSQFNIANNLVGFSSLLTSKMRVRSSEKLSMYCSTQEHSLSYPIVL